MEKRVLKQKHWFRSKHGLNLKLKHMCKAGFLGYVIWRRVLGKAAFRKVMRVKSVRCKSP